MLFLSDTTISIYKIKYLTLGIVMTDCSFLGKSKDVHHEGKEALLKEAYLCETLLEHLYSPHHSHPSVQ